VSTRCPKLLIAVTAALVAGACGGGSAGPDGRPPDNFDRKALLSNLARNVIYPAYQQALSDGSAMQSAVQSYCSALGTATEAETLATARTAWRSAMAAWQRAEMMLLGPAAMDDKTLRDRIYSWPVVSPCAVDQDVMAAYNDSAYDISNKLTNRRGFDALEYLLFSESLASVCPPQSAPVGWDALTDDTKKSARCAFADKASADLVAQLQTVVDAWDPAKGNYIGVLESAGDTGSMFASAQAAVNVVSDAMFYIHNEVQDMKLGEPAGITINSCATVQEPCLAELESQYAAHSLPSVVENLIAFEQVFLGNDAAGTPGVGFDDFLRELDAGALADKITSDITAARTAAEGLSGPLRDALSTDYNAVVALHALVKTISDEMKSQFTAVLALELPDSAAADND
jgi:predicted lipoprotein